MYASTSWLIPQNFQPKNTTLPLWLRSAPFKEEVGAWIGKLATVSEAVEGWLAVQAMWSYMEAVFSGGDIVKQLPAEAKRFQNIDKGYMKVTFTSTDGSAMAQAAFMQAEKPHSHCLTSRRAQLLAVITLSVASPMGDVFARMLDP